MPKQRIANYIFDPTNSQLTLTDLDIVRLDRLLLVVDVTVNRILFNFADSTLLASISNVNGKSNAITFSGASMVGLAATDSIIVFYDAQETDTLYDTPLTGWTGLEVVPLSVERHVDRGRLRIADPRLAALLTRQLEYLEEIRDLLLKVAE